MQKNLLCRESGGRKGWTSVRIPLLSLLCICGLALSNPASAQSPQQRITLNVKGASIQQAINQITSSTRYKFTYLKDDLPAAPLRDFAFTNAPIDQVMNALVAGTDLQWTISNGAVVITRKPAAQATTVTITGRVVGQDSLPLPGVSVVIRGTSVGAVTNDDGRFSFKAPKADDIVVEFSSVGTRKASAAFTGKPLYIVLKTESNVVEEVVVQTGIFQRDKTSFTGASAAFTGSELKAMGNSNVLQSLKMLDPSFVMVDNIAMGSNPNAMPTVELRGQGAASVNAIKDQFSADPNQPLFILNGVEVPISKINDLDMNRVESVTILKDAGSTAIYGSKGANGVVVIETIKPKSGEFKVYYGGDFELNTPDLSVYNMMNSAEKLEFERLSGKYKMNGYDEHSAATQKAYDELYNHLLAEVLRGVDTYWLNEPVRTGFTQAHSVRVSGGSNELAMDIGGKYKNYQGTMKGSSRETWGGNIGLTYRTGKVIVSDFLDLSGYSALNSPYGNFRTWVNTNPYFRKYDPARKDNKYLQERLGFGSYDDKSTVTQDIPNPLYNASLDSEDSDRQFYVSNSFVMQYNPIEPLQLKGAIDMSRTEQARVVFVSPEHTDYTKKSIYERGSYSNGELKSSYYRGYLNAVYALNLDKHTLTTMLRGELSQTDNNYLRIEAQGFPIGSRPSPNLAHQYKSNSRPEYSEQTRRTASFIASVNYNYDRRYLFDFSTRIDGATTFGSNKIFKSFYSAGLGWNINREKFAENWTWAELFKLRASAGMSGNQNIGQITSKTVYETSVESNVFGSGAYLSALGAPNIPWQVSRDLGIGLEFKGFKGRLSMVVDLYNKTTDPMIINVNQTPSTGLKVFPMDLGQLINHGIEGNFTVNPVYNMEKRIIWGIRLTGAMTRSKYDGLGSMLENMNAELREQKSLQYYMDGYSPTDIWAVRSYGIDPATGEEIYVKKNGELTLTYDPADIVVVGNSKPDIQGVLGTYLRYKDFYFNLSMRYSAGGYRYNDALFNKVENINKAGLESNQDRRALYDRWKNPGDLAGFKSIKIMSDATTPDKTSRFVQKDDYLRGESISISYEKNDSKWLKRNLAVQTLKVSFYMTDFFWAETIKAERGIEYPFARFYSLGLNLSF